MKKNRDAVVKECGNVGSRRESPVCSTDESVKRAEAGALCPGWASSGG